MPAIDSTVALLYAGAGLKVDLAIFHGHFWRLFCRHATFWALHAIEQPIYAGLRAPASIALFAIFGGSAALCLAALLSVSA